MPFGLDAMAHQKTRHFLFTHLFRNNIQPPDPPTLGVEQSGQLGSDFGENSRIGGRLHGRRGRSHRANMANLHDKMKDLFVKLMGNYRATVD
jgi:hypothetical protein